MPDEGQLDAEIERDRRRSGGANESGESNPVEAGPSATRPADRPAHNSAGEYENGKKGFEASPVNPIATETMQARRLAMLRRFKTAGRAAVGQLVSFHLRVNGRRRTCRGNGPASAGGLPADTRSMGALFDCDKEEIAVPAKATAV